MKTQSLFPISVLFGLLLTGCSSETQPAAVPYSARPKVEILSARNLGDDKIEVTIRLQNLGPRKYELNVGLGYNPTEEQLNRLPMGVTGSNYNMTCHKQIVDDKVGELSVVLNPRGRILPGAFNGLVHVNLSEYPHSARWSPVARDQKEAAGP